MNFPLAMSLVHLGMIALLVFGFGFVIFWHELGHFLAAKAVGIRVEQFAVGFGQALISWRKGIGLRTGGTEKEFRERAAQRLAETNTLPAGNPDKPGQADSYSDEQIFASADALGLGETEYRLNWIPLGGYVKMLGQDDMKPDAQADDPRAYNKKPVGARMLVISAGVIMNVILAAIGFMVLFLIGFKVPPAWVGNIAPGSPAQRGGLHVGDRIVSFDGHPQQDFTKITLSTALVKEGTPIRMVVDRPKNAAASDEELKATNPADFERITLIVQPARREQDKSFLAIGFEQPRLLSAPKADEDEKRDLEKWKESAPLGAQVVQPGDAITAVNGTPVGPRDFTIFDSVIQKSAGQPIKLTVTHPDGSTSEATNDLHFEEPFSGPFNIAGMQPRTQVYQFADNSKSRGADKLKMGDVIASVTVTDPFPHPAREQLIQKLNAAGHDDKTVSLTVIRDGKPVDVSGLETVKLDRDRYGLGIVLICDEQSTVIANVSDSSPAKAAGLMGGDTILEVEGQPVKTWFDVQNALAKLTPGPAGTPIAATASIKYQRENVAEPRQTTLSFSPEQMAAVHEARYASDVQMAGLNAELTIDRITADPITACKWGVSETRDFILQFCLTLRRMVGGSVSPSNMMGPVGIFVGGTHFAYKGIDWLLWFLCMISANLAVVNFLPIPVVDGGHFMFLLLEKIKGKPLSPRAMVIAQYIGLAFLLAVVLFVTYNDIARQI